MVTTGAPRVEKFSDPDGREFWVDRRPLPPTWDDPRPKAQSAESPSETEISQHVSPDGRVFWIDRRPRVTWDRPQDWPDGPEPITTGTGADEPRIRKTSTATACDASPPPPQRPSTGEEKSPDHPEFLLLMMLTRWRLAQVLSGYPDARTSEVDTIINLLSTRIAALSDLSQLEPLESWFIKGAYDLISSEVNLNFIQTSSEPAKTRDENVFSLSRTLWYTVARPLLYFFLLGAPGNYKQRLGKADWVQWASSKRWTDQQKAIDGFLKSLLAEWNLIILLSTLLLSATVGFLALQDLGRVPSTAVLISLIFSLGTLALSVAFVWRYQRQLNNTYDIRRVMNEFIYDSDEEILPIFLSLPVAFLLWSVISFAVGVMSYAWSRLPRAESPIGVTLAATIIFVFSTLTWVLHRKMGVWKRSWRRKIKLGGGSLRSVHLGGEASEMEPLESVMGV